MIPDGTGPMVATISNWCGSAPVPIAQAQTQAGGPEVVVIGLRGLTVTEREYVALDRQSRPVILAVNGNASISGTIDANASGTTPGAGGNWTCGTSAGTNGTGDSSGGGGGGGGGGFRTAGGNGGDGDDNNNGVGGVTRGTSSLSPLFGGCNGGRGGGCTTNGGAGGGAFQLSVNGTLTLPGILRANGAAGVTGCGSEGGGTGGGSGGGILIEAVTLNTTGRRCRRTAATAATARAAARAAAARRRDERGARAARARARTAAARRRRLRPHLDHRRGRAQEKKQVHREAGRAGSRRENL